MENYKFCLEILLDGLVIEPKHPGDASATECHNHSSSQLLLSNQYSLSSLRSAYSRAQAVLRMLLCCYVLEYVIYNLYLRAHTDTTWHSNFPSTTSCPKVPCEHKRGTSTSIPLILIPGQCLLEIFHTYTEVQEFIYLFIYFTNSTPIF